MKSINPFILGCLLAVLSNSNVEVTSQEVAPETEGEDMSEFFDECLTDGFALAAKLQSLAIPKSFVGCSTPSCTAKKSAHAFKVASFGANSRSLCQGQGMLQASILVQNRLGIPIEQTVAILSEIDLSEESCQRIFATCLGLGVVQRDEVLTYDSFGSRIPVCANNRYRELDGFCNNLRDLELGTTLRSFTRLLPPVYDDGLSSPRGFNETLNPLPNPRNVSAILMNVPESTRPQIVTQMVKAYGQFLDHDITRTPEGSAGMSETGETLLLECCEEGEFVESEFISPECLPIEIPPEDEFFTSRGIECLQFVRSTPADAGCVFGPRQQFNEVTSFLDGSNVYGSTKEESDNLRNWERGNLAHQGEEEVVDGCVTNIPLVFLPPGDNDPEANFRAGDRRVNEQPSLAAMHTVWMRIHNRIADLIYGTTSFQDEATFQEARRIVIALMQHFTYNNFLPLVVGQRTMTSFGLYSLPHEEYNSIYSPSIDPTISNVFGTAAFRFGHTLITDDMSGITPFSLGDEFFRAATLFENITTQPSSIMQMEALMQALPTDVVLDDVLTTRLALGSPEEGEEGEFPDHGSDLMALNIMRGRDHGLQGYTAWRRFCGLRDINSFDEMRTVMDPETVDQFERVYMSVDDVDIFPAGMAENPLLGGGILGPTFSCLIGLQFKALKYGDRYFYENGPYIHRNNPDIPFTRNQLSLIKSTNFGQILCEVTCVDEYPFNVFRFRENQATFDCSRQRSGLFTALEAGEWFC